MKNGCFEVGDRVREPKNSIVHIVYWATNHAFETLCERIVEDHQPAYWAELASWDDEDYPDVEELLAERLQQTHVAPDEPTTCLFCLFIQQKVAQRAEEKAKRLFVFNTEEYPW